VEPSGEEDLVVRVLLTIFNSGVLRKPSRRPGRYGIRLSRVFTGAVSRSMFCLVRLASERFRFGQTAPGWVQFVRIRRELAGRQL
jgi:hypothetical protein